MRRSVPLICLCLIAGCYSYTSLEVRAIDAETRQPLAHIRAMVGYEGSGKFLGPRGGMAKTDSQGIARVKICRNPPGRLHFAAIFFPGFLVDEAEPRRAMVFPTDSLRENTGQPHRLDAALLTWQEYQKRYPR